MQEKFQNIMLANRNIENIDDEVGEESSEEEELEEDKEDLKAAKVLSRQPLNSQGDDNEQTVEQHEEPDEDDEEINTESEEEQIVQPFKNEKENNKKLLSPFDTLDQALIQIIDKETVKLIASYFLPPMSQEEVDERLKQASIVRQRISLPSTEEEREADDREIREILDFSYRDLTNCNFSYKQLQEANFEGSFLRGVHMEHAHLEGASFSHATLTDVRMEYGHLQGASFRNAQMDSAHMQHAQLHGANFSEVDLRNANFEHANLSDASFTIDNDLSGVKFDHADLTDVRFENCDLQGDSTQEEDTPPLLLPASFNFTIINGVHFIDVSWQCLDDGMDEDERGNVRFDNCIGQAAEWVMLGYTNPGGDECPPTLNVAAERYIENDPAETEEPRDGKDDDYDSDAGAAGGSTSNKSSDISRTSNGESDSNSSSSSPSSSGSSSSSSSSSSSNSYSGANGSSSFWKNDEIAKSMKLKLLKYDCEPDWVELSEAEVASALEEGGYSPK